MAIHSTAIVDPTAIIGDNVDIGPYCIVGPDVVIDNDCVLWSHVVVGTCAEMRVNKNSDYSVQIDKGTRIREFVTINAGTVNHTTVGKHCLIMAHSHIGHDAVLENGITVSTGAKIGGHSKLLHYCNIGMNAVLHQRTTIGQYAIVAAGAAVVKDVLPCSKYIPGKPVGINIHAIEKYSLFKDEIDQLHDFGWNSVSTLTWDTLLWVDAYRELDRIMAEKRDKSRDIYSKGVW